MKLKFQSFLILLGLFCSGALVAKQIPVEKDTLVTNPQTRTLGGMFSDPIPDLSLYNEKDAEGLREFLKYEYNAPRLGLTNIDTDNWLKDATWITKLNGVEWVDSPEGKRVKSISYPGKPLSGIFDGSYFEYLETLDFRNNRLLGLKLSKNVNLISVNCNNNVSRYQLTVLELPEDGKLETVYCDNNELTTLKASGENLVYLSCNNNLLVQLDVSQAPNLKEIYCRYNNLKELQLSKNLNLVSLDCNYNKLTLLELPEGGKLENVHCDANALSYLKASGENLTHVSCNYNNLTELDLGDCPNLKEVHCRYNNLQFSTLPILDTDVYVYAPQNGINGGKVQKGDRIDLSTEYMVNGNTTTYKWDMHGVELTFPTDGNGIFVTDSIEAEGKLISRMTNSEFPELTLEIEYELTNPNYQLRWIDSPAFESEVSIYPNPATDVLYINGSDDIQTIEIYTVDGRLVKKFGNAKSNSINIQDLQSGIYVLVAKTLSGQTSAKFTKR